MYITVYKAVAIQYALMSKSLGWPLDRLADGIIHYI